MKLTIHNMAIASLVILQSFAQLACQSESQSLAPAPVEYGFVANLAEPVKIDINPQVDILFVIDDSGSMRAHQAKLVQNIDRFVDGFGKSSLIDPHIGILTVWDSVRYGFYDIQENRVTRPGVVPAVGRDQSVKFDPIGHLRTPKAPQGKEDLLKAQEGAYIKKADGFVEILRESLKVGVRHYVEKTTDKEDASGPEYEELFTPVMAALRPPVSNAWNKGFLREKAHLVVVYLTDADDASVVTADHMFRFLRDLKGEDNFTVFGVINPSNQKLNCQRDRAGAPDKIETLIRRSHGRALNMCSDYGKELVEIGKMVQDRTIKTIRIPLERLPVVDKIQVTYGDSIIPQDNWSGWSYDGDSKEIIIRGASQWPHQPGAKISVVYEPVDPSRVTSHCLGCPSKEK